MTANTNPLASKHVEYGMPRYGFLEANHPAERAIWDALQAVEMLGTDPQLTRAVFKLAEAGALVADWLEGKEG